MNNPASSKLFTLSRHSRPVWLAFVIISISLAQSIWQPLPAQHHNPPLSAVSAAPPLQAKIPTSFNQTKLSFEANRGQASKPVQFIARGAAASLYLQPAEATMVLHKAQGNEQIKMQLIGAQSAQTLNGEQSLPGTSNYFSGNNSITDVPTYERVRYAAIYPGIDLIFYGKQQELEYDFIVAPGANPAAIRIKFAGARKMYIADNGELVLQCATGEIRQHKPVVYQQTMTGQQTIQGQYIIHDNNQVSFAIGAYDHSRELIIDPIISYATFFGTDLTSPIAITADRDGNVYLARNHGLPATAGAYQNGEAFSITKLNKSGTTVLYTATFGGGELDRVHDMTVDANGNLYLTGQASSSTFPTTAGAYQTDFGLTGSSFLNAFVAKLNPSGTALLYSTYLKGDSTYRSEKKGTIGRALAVDGQDNVYVVGHTNTFDFPVSANALQNAIATYNKTPPVDVFVTKLNTNGSGLVYSTYLGSGGNNESGTDIAVDAQGNAYITGYTGDGWVGITQPQGTKFPVTPGAYQLQDRYGLGNFLPTYVYVSKINPTGTALVYSTLIGTVAGNIVMPSLALDAGQNVYVTGWTQSKTFPTTAGAYKTSLNAEAGNAFVTRLNASGSVLVYSTYLGGSNADYGTGITVDAAGNAMVTGTTNSNDFPQIGATPESIEYGGFITKLNAVGSGLVESSFLRGTRDPKIVADPNGNCYLTGATIEGFQTTPGAFQSLPATSFIIKITAPRAATTVSAASYAREPLACEAIVSSFGSGLATATNSASSLPLPTNLAGTSVKVKDSAGVEREAPVFFVSPTQVNYQIPPHTANGSARVTITSGDGTVSMSDVEIVNVAPSLFSADSTGRGFAAAQVQRAGSSQMEPTVAFDPMKGQLVALPIDLSASSDDVYLVLYATGIRMNTERSLVSAKIGSVAAEVSYAGAQGGFVGLDQINVKIPRSLIGRGTVDIALSINGKAANVVKVTVK